MIKDEQDIVWFKQGYVWLVISFPLAAVIAGIITMILAIQTDDGLVVDDYYKQGLAINRTLERDQVAASYQLSANLQYAADNANVRLFIQANADFVYPEKLKASFLNAARAGVDKEQELTRVDENTYIGPNPKLGKGKWHVIIETDEWRLLEVLHIP